MLAHAVLAAASVALAAAYCPGADWLTSGDRCFKGFLAVKSQSEAQLECERVGTSGRLAFADTDDVVAKLFQISKAMEGEVGMGKAWTGGVCKDGRRVHHCHDKAQWTWGSGGNTHGAFETGIWANNYPLADRGKCMYIDNNSISQTFKNLYNCDWKMQYICEVSSSLWTPPPNYKNYNKDQCAAVTLPSGKAGCEALGCIAKMRKGDYKACYAHKIKKAKKSKKSRKVKCKKGNKSQNKCEGLGGGNKCKWNENTRRPSKRCVNK